MRSRRRQEDLEEREQSARLSARIADLEQRLMLLEARLRRTVTEVERPRGRRQGPAPRPRPRCPGCLLELPKGRRGETCVWCGFVFDAVRPAPPKPRVAKGR